MRRLRLVSRSVNSADSAFAVELARAGMSRRLIAKELYGDDKKGKVSSKSLNRVGYLLGLEEQNVTDYRNGQNSLGKVMISAIRSEAKITEAIRGATKEIKAALKRTG